MVDGSFSEASGTPFREEIDYAMPQDDGEFNGASEDLFDFLYAHPELCDYRVEEVAAVPDEEGWPLSPNFGLTEALEGAIRALTPKERMTVVARFGLDGKPARTRKEVAESVLDDVSKQRVDYLEHRALTKLVDRKGFVLRPYWE